MAEPIEQSPRISWKAAAPSLAVSAVLLAVTVCAASVLYVNHSASNLAIDAAIESAESAVKLEDQVEEMRDCLRAFQITGDRELLDRMLELQDSSKRLVSRFNGVVITPEGQRRFSGITARLEDIRRHLHELREVQQLLEVERLIRILDRKLDRELFDWAHSQLETSQQRLKQLRSDSDSMLKWTVWLLGILGVGGTVVGIASGFSLAKALRRQIVELSVIVRTAAGSLDPMAEEDQPIAVEPSDDLAEVQSMVSLLSNRVGGVVKRLQEAERESMRQDQLAALGQLAAGLAHELRNPLTSIKTLVEAARDPQANSPLDDRDLEVIDEEISRLDATLQAFLDYARPPKLERVEADLRDVVRRTVQLAGARAERQSVRIRLNLPATPTLLTLDPEQLRQVVLNLILNSIDALGSGGEVQISVRDEPDQSQVQLVIEDDGPGIKTDLLPRLFEPFVSSKSSGTGLGLTVCRRIVESHGGRIVAENRPTGGARFTVLLPRQTETAPALSEPAYAHAADH